MAAEALGLNLPAYIEVRKGERITLDPGIDPMEIDAFTWSPKEGILNPDELIIEVSPTFRTVYTLVIELGECSWQQAVEVAVRLEETIEIGNIFSPNGDNQNDVLFIQGNPDSNIAIDDFSVYDRWGNQVFQNIQPRLNSTEDGWDGFFGNDLVTP